MTRRVTRCICVVVATCALAACGGPKEKAGNTEAGEHAEAGGHEGEEKAGETGVVALSAQQIADAGIEVGRPTVGGVTGAIETPATIEGDPQGVQVVSAALGGRIVSLTRNLGQPVVRGDTMDAMIEGLGTLAVKVV